MKEWQFNVLFFVGVGGAILLVIGPEFGLQIGQQPGTLTGIGSILAYVLTRKTLDEREQRRDKKKNDPIQKEEADDRDS